MRCWPKATDDEVHAGFTVYEAVGCDECTAGYKGRTGLYQVMPMTDAIATIVLEGGNALQIAEAAQRSGVRALRQSALMKVKLGVTSLAEIRSEAHTSELQSLMRISYAVFCLKQKQTITTTT